MKKSVLGPVTKLVFDSESCVHGVSKQAERFKHLRAKEFLKESEDFKVFCGFLVISFRLPVSDEEPAVFQPGVDQWIFFPKQLILIVCNDFIYEIILY